MPPNAFVTLLTTPSYLPGALVLLHALRELHPEPRDFKIVCLVTPETVDAKTVGELRKAGYDLVIGVEPIASGQGGQSGLHLMGRPDLNFALTKLHLFRLAPLFSTLIYLDADVLPLRPLSHLFATTNPHTLSACPDTGWPDCFNSGVMVIRPRDSDFEGLQNLLKSGEGEDGIYRPGSGSFDGADQGLLNEWFSEEGGGGDWNRLPFTYNVTPTAAYTYAPAYRRYGHKINAVHFIGPAKPWSNLAGRPAGMSLPQGKETTYDYPSLIDRWYAVYDRHVRPTDAHHPDMAKRFAVPEHVAIWNQPGVSAGVPSQPDDRLDLTDLKAAAEKGVTAFSSGGQYISLPLEGRVDLMMPKPQPKPSPPTASAPPPPPTQAQSPTAAVSPIHLPTPLPQSLQQQTQQPATWDAAHYAPPVGSGPEMSIPMTTHYHPAWEQPHDIQAKYFSAPPPAPEPQYPTLPANVRGDQWYKEFTGTVPDRSSVLPVFPWEQAGQQHPRAQRVFPRGSTPPPMSAQQPHTQPTVTVQQPTPPVRSPSPPPQPPPRSMAEAMASYTNAWDSDPKIQRYANKLSGIGIGPSRRESDPRHSMQSVPGTPRYAPTSFLDRKESFDSRSEGSEDGDDEGGSDEESVERRSSPSSSRAPSVHGQDQPRRYRDRFAQTDHPQLADAKVQAVPGGGPSPAVRTVDLPMSSVSIGTGRNGHASNAPSASSTTRSTPTRTGDSSDATARASQIVTPPSDSMSAGGSQRVPFPSSSAAPPRAQVRTHHRHTPSAASVASDHMTEMGVPKFQTPGGRVWDPSTDVESRKKETQEVLTRFIKAGSFGRPGSGSGSQSRQ